MPEPHFQPGDPVVLRGVWRGSLWWACAVTVVQDTSDFLALYWRAGTPNQIPAWRPTVQDLLSGQVPLQSSAWTSTDVLAFIPAGAAHATYLMWEAGLPRVRCWYINLQEPLRRTPLGFDTMDQILDIVVTPDRATWHWKDEDEFQEALALGLLTPAQSRAILLEGLRALQLLQTNQPPYDLGWEAWTPPPAWPVPALPPGWDTLP